MCKSGMEWSIGIGPPTNAVVIIFLVVSFSRQASGGLGME